MATETDVGQIEIELESLRLMIDDLREVADEWDTLDGAERAAWSLDWDQVMGALGVVRRPAFENGQMTPDQHRRYRCLTDELTREAPFLHRLNLSAPESLAGS